MGVRLVSNEEGETPGRLVIVVSSSSCRGHREVGDGDEVAVSAKGVIRSLMSMIENKRTNDISYQQKIPANVRRSMVMKFGN